MADNKIRQKLHRCGNVDVSAKDRQQALQHICAGVADKNSRQSQSKKNSFVANGLFPVLVGILRCENEFGPQYDYSVNIFTAGGPDWRYDFMLQAEAALTLRRLVEIGDSESSTGFKRVNQAVSDGCLPVLVPHLYVTSCCSGYASGALKEIAKHDMFRQLICQAGALKPLRQLLQKDIEVCKTSFRNASECLHLLSCSVVEDFIDNGVLDGAIETAMNKAVGDKPMLASVLTIANLTAGDDGEELGRRLQEVYVSANFGGHLCRLVYSTTTKKRYLTIAASQLDIIKSVFSLASSEVGRRQLVGAWIKEECTHRQLTLVDILAKILRENLSVAAAETCELVLEVYLHLSFAEDGIVQLQRSPECMSTVKRIAGGALPGECGAVARNVMRVVSGGLVVAPGATSSPPQEKKGPEEAIPALDAASAAPIPAAALVVDAPVSTPTADKSPVAPTGQKLPHVMISYSWAHQSTILDLCEQLKLAGIPYWLDVEQMQGNINDRMAEAIESCCAVLVGVSSKYKQSANCRMEAEYSNAQRKNIIPVMVESKYRADGWLGLVISGKLYYDISGEEERERSLTGLLAAVRGVVQEAARTTSTADIARSLALFADAPAEGERAVDEGCENLVQEAAGSDDETTEATDGAISVRAATRPVPSSAPGDSGVVDSVAVLLEQLQVGVIAHLDAQMAPVLASLQRIDERLGKLESQVEAQKA